MLPFRSFPFLCVSSPLLCFPLLSPPLLTDVLPAPLPALVLAALLLVLAPILLPRVRAVLGLLRLVLAVLAPLLLVPAPRASPPLAETRAANTQSCACREKDAANRTNHSENIRFPLSLFLTLSLTAAHPLQFPVPHNCLSLTLPRPYSSLAG